ncbi:hypothetical protein bmyco0003_19660 [Bacillus pseudomycoides]|uniref:hypothetical protein n=1 Tax=Bacillus TaxID=1386 RepID=UPI0001A14CD0|nr:MULTISPECIES: hypothetical protein [Bacillus]EEM05545.1 hypothetical protein bmyco0002_19650 [Bacillus pseudomycoides]EEM11271.1 hypothetical protein bmyco0003_19660 [Bacillus pseudomycoides]PGC30287.1 hypothetical protein COM18_28875 [Bacillus pseudomycoides]
MFKRKTVNDLSYSETVDKIIELNEHLKKFWSTAQGWAPIEAANLLSKSRLDWLASLSYSLHKWDQNPEPNSEHGDLILAWANLGALVEGSLKFFLSVYYETYKTDINAMSRRGNQIDPDGAMFNGLKNFFNDSVWSDSERKDKTDWLTLVQERRNAIHAYKDKDINDFDFFRKHVKNYLQFLMDLIDRLPYPDEAYRPNLIIR